MVCFEALILVHFAYSCFGNPMMRIAFAAGPINIIRSIRA